MGPVAGAVAVEAFEMRNNLFTERMEPDVERGKGTESWEGSVVLMPSEVCEVEGEEIDDPQSLRRVGGGGGVRDGAVEPGGPVAVVVSLNELDRVMGGDGLFALSCEFRRAGGVGGRLGTDIVCPGKGSDRLSARRSWIDGRRLLRGLWERGFGGSETIRVPCCDEDGDEVTVDGTEGSSDEPGGENIPNEDISRSLLGSSFPCFGLGGGGFIFPGVRD